MINIAILESNDIQKEIIQSHILSWAKPINDVTIYSFSDKSRFLESMSINSYHAVFINVQIFDLNHGEASGLETARLMRRQQYRNTIIFISDTENYAIDGYEVGAYRYILTPIQPKDIQVCMNYVSRRYSDKSFAWSYRGEKYILSYNSIIYIESQKHNITFVTDCETFTFKSSLTEILKHTPRNFFRCHRSYIVNLDYIKSFGAKKIVLLNGTDVPVAAKYVPILREAMNSIVTLATSIYSAR